MMRDGLWSSVMVVGMLALGVAGGCGAAPPPKPAELDADPPLGSSSPSSGMVTTEVQRAAAFIKAEKWADAKEHLDRALAQQPNSAEANYYTGIVKEKTGDCDGAIESYKKALAADGALTEAANNLAAMYLDNPPKPDEAIPLLQKALEKTPDDPALRRNLAYAFGLKGDVAAASKEYETVLAKNDDPAIRLDYATLLFDKKDFEHASTELKKALDKTADDSRRALHDWPHARLLEGLRGLHPRLRSRAQGPACEGGAARPARHLPPRLEGRGGRARRLRGRHEGRSQERRGAFPTSASRCSSTRSATRRSTSSTRPSSWPATARLARPRRPSGPSSTTSPRSGRPPAAGSRRSSSGADGGEDAIELVEGARRRRRARPCRPRRGPRPWCRGCACRRASRSRTAGRLCRRRAPRSAPASARAGLGAARTSCSTCGPASLPRTVLSAISAIRLVVRRPEQRARVPLAELAAR